MIFHPFEFSFCGFSNTGKTTLISNIIKSLSTEKPEYTIGYIKHDAHHFEMDKEGKDTWLAKKSGAHVVSINDQSSKASISCYNTKNIFKSEEYSNCDFVLIEGYKKENIPKALLLNGKFNIFDSYASKETHAEEVHLGSIKCFVYTDRADLSVIPEQLRSLPTFSRDDISGITKFFLDELRSSFDRKNVKGLILGGGKSKRMGFDKTSLEYHKGVGQLEYLHDLLSKHCSDVFVSCRQEQAREDHFNNFSVITDRFLDFGPIGGILSAQLSDPQAYWLVVACDLPFLSQATIKYLLDNVRAFKSATCFKNKHRREPLCSVYAPSSHPILMKMLGLGHKCPQKFLWNANVEVLEPVDERDLNNANVMEEYLQYKKEISNETTY